MPIREYDCSSCGLVFSKLIPGFSPPSETACEGCGRNATLRLSIPSILSPANPSTASNPKSDVVIGHNAEKAWQEYRRLKQIRKPVADMARKLGTGITADTAVGHIRTMTPKELSHREAVINLWKSQQKSQKPQ